MAVVSSLRSFDREQQKEYLVPIVIKDSGNPSMTGTSTLTVVIGDSNDNKMQPGQKDIMVYNYMVSNCFLICILALYATLHSRASHPAQKLAEFMCMTKMTGISRIKLSIGKMERLIPTFH